MKRLNIFIISLKKNILSILFILFTICLVVFSKQNLHATQEGLLLCANSVIPALFPFFIATELLSYTNIIPFIGKKLNKFMRPIFRVPGEGAYAFLMGIISGYPVGAKIVTNMRNQNHCTKAEGERLLAFTNNSGPLFIMGTVGISLFGSIKIGYILLITHVISSLIVGYIFRNWKKDYVHSELFSKKEESQKAISLRDLGEILGNSIKKSIGVILNIGGFIVIFSVILSILEEAGFFNIIGNICNIFNIQKDIGISLISGIIELTNGVKKVSLLGISKLNIIVAGFLLGFGGISVLFQVYSIVSKEGISIKPYFYGKLLQGIISAILLGIILCFIVI